MSSNQSAAMERDTTCDQTPNEDGADEAKECNEVPECFKYSLSQLFACTANGLSYETITQDGSSVVTLEIFFSGFPRMVGLSLFPNLCRLTVVGQDLTKMEALDCCPLLQELWVAECRLTELTMLACLPQLGELVLSDPTTTPNPVCLLHNYATHVLYHMPHLQQLDTHDVSSLEVKDTAELELELSKASAAQEVKDGSAGDSGHSCNPSLDARLEQKISEKIGALKKRLAFWTRRLDEIDAWFEQKSSQAARMTDYTVQFLLMELESVGNIRLEEGCPAERWFASCCDLLLSRFSLADFKAHGVSGIQINRGVRIHNTAVRLRFEDKFDSLRVGNDGPGQNYRCQLEHLFYVSDPEKNEKKEILGIIEEGFKGVKEVCTRLQGSQRQGLLPFSNSLFLSEQPRISHALRHTCNADSDPVPFRHGMFQLPFLLLCLSLVLYQEPTLPVGQVIISKVFVGQSVPVLAGIPVSRSHYPKAYSVYQNVESKLESGRSEERPVPSSHGEDAPSRDGVLDDEALSMEPVLRPQPRLLSLDDELLLSMTRANFLSQITVSSPSRGWEREFRPPSCAQNELMSRVQVLSLHGNSLNRMKELCGLTELRHLDISFNKFTRLDDISHMPNLESLDVSYNHLTTLEGLRGLERLKQLDVSWNRLTKSREEAAVLRKHAPMLLKLDTRYNRWEKACLLAHARSSAGRPRCLSLLSTAQLLCLLGPPPWGLSQDLEPDWAAKITTLNLDNLGVSKLTNLSSLVNLRWASFNDNDISKVEGLDSCLSLEELSLDNNSISTLGDKSLPLWAGTGKPHHSGPFWESRGEGRKLSHLRLVPPTCPQSPGWHRSELFSNLRTVRLDHNHLTSFSGLIHLPSVRYLSLNYNHVESILPRQKIPHLTNKQILYNKVHSSGYGKQRPPKGLGEPGQIGGLEPLMGSLEVLHLSHNGISSMAGLELSRLTGLKALFLEGNEIRHVDGLERLHQLRELVLDKNRIKALADNSFKSQNALLELHLSENRIQDFSHLEHLTELRKLFLDANKVQDIAELEKLEVLTSLLELSLVDNPVTNYSIYRPSVALRLPLLQMLDGERVTLEERTRAELLSIEEIHCCDCSGPCPNASELSLTGLPPIISQPTAQKDKSGGFQDARYGHFIQPHNTDEAQSRTASKYKRQKQVNNTQSGLTDMSYRHIRRTAAPTGLSHRDKESPSRLAATRKAADSQNASNLFPCSTQKR
ncbi:unnamed protein product [Tetraodon nigroviridis]|uniref:(spotted green pufferfish) hypothetical protein n=1 Tax=Tetraodon nigroviridis TaxID=99883 RepID=Q4RM29_TETNG|nr:unnamed protein product [Tetraodon nigroviridis]